ncbi:MAG: aminotransferase class I/II-fold pyridoxal phosphate-dependent enzyme [Deltaproteobacteria bacterium]|nr:aminotransferase class I/II-fold pyridoxal phosphate-dependent enzyme [Deltaproteobacteria bacterium]
MKQLKPSATLAFHQKVREHVKLGKEIFSLGLGEAEVPTPPHIVEAGMKALRDGMTRYSTPQGLPALRERIAYYLRTAHGMAGGAERVIVTPGAKNALFLACAALLEPGDEVVLLRPCYVSNAPILHIAAPGIRLREVDMAPRSFDLDREKLSRAVTDDTRLLFVNTPHNPTGRMLSTGDVLFLADLLRRHPRLHLLSDEVYESMVVGDAAHFSPASIPDIAERVVTVGGFSKTYFMTGWRIGYVHADKAVVSAMLAVHEHINTNTAAFIQQAAIAALDGSRECVVDYVRKLKERKAVYDRFMGGSPHLSGTAFEGGYFTFVDISASRMDCDAFAVALLAEKSVAMVPGLAFGANCRDYCRLSFVNDTGIFEEGLNRVREFMESIAYA